MLCTKCAEARGNFPLNPMYQARGWVSPWTWACVCLVLLWWTERVSVNATVLEQKITANRTRSGVSHPDAFLLSPKLFAKEAILQFCGTLLPDNAIDFHIPLVNISNLHPLPIQDGDMTDFGECAVEIATRFFSTKLVEFYMLWTNLQEDVNHRLKEMKADEFSPIVHHLEGSIIGFVDKLNVLAHYANDARVETICEIGFNVGHSAAFMAIHNPKASFIEFDIFFHNYSGMALTSLQDHFFPDRNFVGIAGDSTVSVNRFVRMFPERKCNLIVIDGGHTREILRKDIINFQAMANRTFHRLIIDDSTMDDLFEEYSSFIALDHFETAEKKMAFELNRWSELSHVVPEFLARQPTDPLARRVPLRHVEHHPSWVNSQSNCFNWEMHRMVEPLLSYGTFRQLNCSPDAIQRGTQFYEGISVVSIAEYLFDD